MTDGWTSVGGAVAVGDFNGDSRPDIVAGGGSELSLLLNITGVGITVSVDDVSKTEGDTASSPLTFTVTRTVRSDTDPGSTVVYRTVDGAATAPADYTATSGTLRFVPGQTTKTVRVPIVGDATPEADETFSLVLSQAQGATLIDSIGTAVIQDDD